MGEGPVTEEILSGRVAGTLLRCADATTGVVVLADARLGRDAWELIRDLL